MPVRFGSRKAARTSWGQPYARRISLGGGSKDGGDGGVCRWVASADARVPVGFVPQRRSDNEARSAVRRWDLAPGKQRE